MAPGTTARSPERDSVPTVPGDVERGFSPTRGVISTHEVYTLPEFQRRMRLGQFAMRQARRKGLVVFRIGRREYVRGADLAKFFDQQASDKAPSHVPAGSEVTNG